MCGWMGVSVWVDGCECVDGRVDMCVGDGCVFSSSTTVHLEAEITRLKSKLVALLNEQDAPMLMSGSETVMQEQEVSMLLREAMESGTLMTPEADPKPTPEKKEV